MNSTWPRRRIVRLSVAAAALFWLAGCGTTELTPNALAPQGPAAGRIAVLWWVMLGLGALVYVVVMGFLAWALWRRRQEAADEPQKDWLGGKGRRFVLLGGVMIPAVILVVVYAFTLNTLTALSYRGDPDQLLIEVVGHQWWWEVNYPHQRVVTANEIHIPAGRPVQLKLTAADVIHSFWVPELHGKLDLLPGRTNTLWIEADTPGEYWGVCAEFCGTQHAKMLLIVIAQPEEAFAAWLEGQQELAAEPAGELESRGQQVFMDAGCNDCHTIRGSDAAGTLGPDLTHFATRQTLGSAIAPNNRGHLAGWILDPHGLKPGNLMPATALSGTELEGLLAYLESLQ